ncbi:MAG: methyltransferase domain-containing protein [Nitrososphaerales archaeon]
MAYQKKATIIEYDKMAERYDIEERSEDSIYPLRSYINSRELMALNLINNVKNEKVLDIGTGTGRFALRLTKRGAETYGIEISEKMLLKAKEKAKKYDLMDNLHLILGDAENLPFRSEIFNRAMSMTVINHLPHPERAIEEMSRVLKVNGIAVISSPNIFSLRGIPYAFRVLKEKIFRIKNVRMCALKFTPWKLQIMHKNAGLKILRIQGVVWVPLPPKLNYKLRTMKIIERVEKIFDNLPLIKMIAGTITIKSIKRLKN